MQQSPQRGVNDVRTMPVGRSHSSSVSSDLHLPDGLTFDREFESSIDREPLSPMGRDERAVISSRTGDAASPRPCYHYFEPVEGPIGNADS
jgi:hypothetical protein